MFSFSVIRPEGLCQPLFLFDDAKVDIFFSYFQIF